MKCHKKSIELYAICGVNKIGPLILCLLHRQKDVCGIPDPSSLQIMPRMAKLRVPSITAIQEVYQPRNYLLVSDLNPTYCEEYLGLFLCRRLAIFGPQEAHQLCLVNEVHHRLVI